MSRILSLEENVKNETNNNSSKYSKSNISITNKKYNDKNSRMSLN